MNRYGLEIIRVENVDPELKMKIKIEAVRQKTTMREIIIKALKERFDNVVCHNGSAEGE